MQQKVNWGDSKIQNFLLVAQEVKFFSGHEHAIFVNCNNQGYNLADHVHTNSKFQFIPFHDLVESKIDWEATLDPKDLTDIFQKNKQSIRNLEVRLKNRELFAYQRKAVQASLNHFRDNDRGTLIMACGTGKTFTAFKFLEEFIKEKSLEHSQENKDNKDNKDKLAAKPVYNVLFAVPSLALLNQTLKDWRNNAKDVLNLISIIVCSDNSLDEDTSIENLLLNGITTDPQKVVDLQQKAKKHFAQLNNDLPNVVVVFSTYHSMEVLAQAQKITKELNFVLSIADEAHRTTGLAELVAATNNKAKDKLTKAFQLIHDNKNVLIEKRLYMTATPRIYKEKAKQKSKDKETNKDILASMDDKKIYGEAYFSYKFDQAIDDERLTPYKLIVEHLDYSQLTPDIQDKIKEFCNTTNGMVNMVTYLKVALTWKALNKIGKTIEYQSRIRTYSNNEEEVIADKEIIVDGYGDLSTKMLRSIFFTNQIAPITNKDGSIRKSKKDGLIYSTAVAKYAQAICEHYQEHIITDEDKEKYQSAYSLNVTHVDGKQNANERAVAIDQLELAKAEQNKLQVLSNVRCLSEGVDVPSLDAVAFLTPISSKVEIIQAVGRVMRKSPGKQFGYIILPLISCNSKAKDIINNMGDSTKQLIDIINALRAHDSSIARDCQYNFIPSQFIVMENPRLTVKKENVDNSLLIQEDKKKKEDIKDPELLQEPKPENLVIQKSWLNSEKAMKSLLLNQVSLDPTWEAWSKKLKAKEIPAFVKYLENIAYDKTNPAHRYFQDLWNYFVNEINVDISQERVIMFVLQYNISLPIFKAIYNEELAITQENPVAQKLEEFNLNLKLVDSKYDNGFNNSVTFTELKTSVVMGSIQKESITHAERIDLVKRVYEKIIKILFPEDALKYGIVYTPREAVHFMIKSTDYLLKKHFNKEYGLAAQDVRILDPFTGTGAFANNVFLHCIDTINSLDLDLAEKEKLIQDKYKHGIYFTEIMPIAYFMASIGIEAIYYEYQQKNFRLQKNKKVSDKPKYEPFIGSILGDSFQIYEKWRHWKKDAQEQQRNIFDYMDREKFGKLDNNERVEKLFNEPVNAVITNPPYKVGPTEMLYALLNKSMQETFKQNHHKYVSGRFKDLYIRSIRISADYILENEEGGIINFIVNNSFLNSPTMNGIRKSLSQEFSQIYILDLKGDQSIVDCNLQGEGGKFFGEESKNGICILFLLVDKKLKKLQANKPADIFYYAVHDKNTQDKRDFLRQTVSLQSFIEQGLFTKITLDSYNNWLEHRNDSFNDLIPLNKNKDKNNLFSTSIAGGKTGKDAWLINSSKDYLETNLKQLIDTLNNKKQEKIDYNLDLIRSYMFRPFVKQYCSLDRNLASTYASQERAYIPGIDNPTIALSKGDNFFSAIMVKEAYDQHFLSSTGLPLYDRQEQNSQQSVIQHNNDSKQFFNNISQDKVNTFNDFYNVQNITHEMIFYYVYAMFHCPEYLEKFGNNLKKEAEIYIPILNKYEDFQTFSQVGKELGDLHMNYEQQQESDQVTIIDTYQGKDDFEHYALYTGKTQKINISIEKDDSVSFKLNPYIKIVNIPAEVRQHRLRDTYALKAFKMGLCIDNETNEMPLSNNFNNFALSTGDIKYTFKLILKIIHISLRTVELSKQLPKLDYDPAQQAKFLNKI